jgi:hypothetical protein
VFLHLLLVVLGIWLLFWPEVARRAAIHAHARIGVTANPPRAVFVRLIGLTWLLLLAWFSLPA